MQTAVAITVIICGTLLAAVPATGRVPDKGAFIYIGLATVMVLSGIVGSFMPRRPRPARGFEALPVADAE